MTLSRVALTLVLAMPALPAGAQTTARIGLLGPDEQPRFADIAAGLRQGLREQGYPDAKVRLAEIRVARGDNQSARDAVARVAAERPAALFVIGSNLARIARDQVPAVPIVFITPGDPVSAGLVESLARPGRNMTALTFEYPELSAKRLELLRELAPSARRVLVLYDPRDASPRQGAEAARAAAGALGFTLIEVEVRSEREISDGLKQLEQADALLCIPGGITGAHYEVMIRAANARRRPTVVFTHSPGTREALLSYGASDVDVARDAARALVKVLEGARAGDLPVERPSKLALVINLRTSRTLGLTVPPALLVRADLIIE